MQLNVLPGKTRPGPLWLALIALLSATLIVGCGPTTSPLLASQKPGAQNTAAGSPSTLRPQHSWKHIPTTHDISGDADDVLNGISGVSAGDIWAVGYSFSGPGAWHTVTKIYS